MQDGPDTNSDTKAATAADLEARFEQAKQLFQQGKLAEAQSIYTALASTDPDSFRAANMLGVIALKTKNYPAAITHFNKAIAVKPDFAGSYYNLGLVFSATDQADKAVDFFDRTIALMPDYADAYISRGDACKKLRRFDDAIADYEKAIAIRPDNVDILIKQGNSLAEVKRMTEALACYDRALSLDPDHAALWDTALHTRMKICDWNGLDAKLDELRERIQHSGKVTNPFLVLTLLDEPGLHKQAAMLYAASNNLQATEAVTPTRHIVSDKIRIGYYSADFHNHATAYLMAELLEKHDPDRFEVYGFSFGTNKQDKLQQRVAAAFSRFFDVSQKNDEEIAQLSREIGIDIAVDLKGYTQFARSGIFAHRCAPIQVNYLGYPGTMGTEHIDYIIADRTIIPDDAQNYYTEKIVYLPHSYQVNDAQRKISEKIFTRQDVGLPDTGFVFCCFNNNFKILPDTFDIWMRLLQAVDCSVLWLLEDNPAAATNLRQAAEARGVTGDRLVFARRLPVDEHLARHRLADLFIDSLPYNAHTTASDALWAGVPLLTCAGRSFASRVAASLLTAIELPELVTCSANEFETRALELARDNDQLAALRLKLAQHRLTTPLFDTALYTQHIESAYRKMYEIFRAGLSPQNIEIN